MITGRKDAAIRAGVLKGGALGLLVKPFENEGFLGLVRRALREGLFVHPLDCHSL
jgi:FixJ family two-component response regulator